MDARFELGSATELWQRLVRRGETRSGAHLDEDVEAYLVFVLMRYLRDDSLLARTMALDWLGAQEESGTTRLDALRDVGDRCLLIAGMFPQQATRRRVGPDYFSAVGRSAYDHVAARTRAGYGQLFAELTRAFDAMVGVLAALQVVAPRREALVQPERIPGPAAARRH